jgi:hypothetical protein
MRVEVGDMAVRARARKTESVIGTDERVVNARDFRRKSENRGRWSVTDFDKFFGMPWETYPGAKRI